MGYKYVRVGSSDGSVLRVKEEELDLYLYESHPGDDGLPIVDYDKPKGGTLEFGQWVEVTGLESVKALPDLDDEEKKLLADYEAALSV